jgi:hypothetical protein
LALVAGRSATRTLNTKAPETTLIDVKLAGSIRSSPKASRHRRELAAKATIAKRVRRAVFEVISRSHYSAELREDGLKNMR